MGNRCNRVFSLFGEKLYLSPILDLYNGKIIAISRREKTSIRDSNRDAKEGF